jgi:hypothetical protein
MPAPLMIATVLSLAVLGLIALYIVLPPAPKQ